MASGYSDLSEIRKDGRNFGAYPKPPKIDLLNERPRRESIVEQQLKSGIIRQQPIIAFDYNQKQQVLSTNSNQSHPYAIGGPQNLFVEQQSTRNNYPYYYMNEQGSYQQKQQQLMHDFNATSRSYGVNRYDTNPVTDCYTTTTSSDSGPIRRTVTTTTSQIGTDNDSGRMFVQNATNSNNHYMSNQIAKQGNVNQQQHVQTASMSYSDLASELAEKEAKLKREIAYLNLHNSPWSRPKQIREPRKEPPPKWARNNERWVREVPNSPSPRPNSRASSNRSIITEHDLLEKAESLLRDVQEIENKSLVTQQILIESGARRSGSSNDNNQQSSSSSPINKAQQDNVSSIHTAIIKVPSGEINNKSPLPFSYDNFSTLGVRGNIASVGAVPPETPYAPIFPMIKRTPPPADFDLNKRY